MEAVRVPGSWIGKEMRGFWAEQIWGKKGVKYRLLETVPPPGLDLPPPTPFP